MLPFRSKLIALCPACGAILPPMRGFVSVARNDDGRKVRISPDRVVVMHKTSRLEFERKRNKHLSESQLQTEVRVHFVNCRSKLARYRTVCEDKPNLSRMRSTIMYVHVLRVCS